MSTIPGCAARGAQLLDTHKPDWFLTTNKDDLDMGSPDECALAQVYASDAPSFQDYPAFPYEFGLEKLDLTIEDAIINGFALGDIRDYEEGIDSTEEGYALLTDAWLCEITLRMNAIPAPPPSGSDACESMEPQLV